MRTPADVYARSTRCYRGERTPRYPARFDVRSVADDGIIKYDNRRLHVGGGFAGLSVGIERVSEQQARIWFYELDLGLVDLTTAPRHH
jgi:hypothetical protein